jgi:SAM-dependent methyltransferase
VMVRSSGDGQHYATTREAFRQLAIHRQGYYDAQAGRPLRHSPWQRRIRRLVLASVTELLGRDATLRTLVDVGCGRGDFLLDLHAACPGLAELWGTDFSPEMLALAAADARGLARVRFREADLLAMPFPAARFDVTVCVNVLHHVHGRDQAHALVELGRITRRYLVLEIKNAANPYYRRIAWREVRGIGRLDIFPTTVDEVDGALGRQGFARRTVRGIFVSRWLSPLLVLVFERRAGPDGP